MFAAQRKFIKEFTEKIIKAGVPTVNSLPILQACLESRYGQRHFFNNYFGIKCHDTSKYAGCRRGTTAEFIDGSYQHNLSLAFQTYDSPEESIEDWVNLINGVGRKGDRYKQVREARDFIEAANEIRIAGFATSPTYTRNLLTVAIRFEIYKYDYLLDPDDDIEANFKWGEVFCSEIVNGRLYRKIIEPYPEVWSEMKRSLKEAQKARDHFKVPIAIESGFRTPRRNAQVGGARNSQHMSGRAIDFNPMGRIPIATLYKWLKENTEFRRFGIGRRTLHADTATAKEAGTTSTLWYYR